MLDLGFGLLAALTSPPAAATLTVCPFPGSSAADILAWRVAAAAVAANVSPIAVHFLARTARCLSASCIVRTYNNVQLQYESQVGSEYLHSTLTSCRPRSELSTLTHSDPVTPDSLSRTL